MGFVQRYTQDPTLEQLLAIEQVAIVDIAPPAPSTGVGSGNLLVVGEFEDGAFAAGGDADAFDPTQRGPQEALGSTDLQQKFGGFGFNRAGVPASDPCARRGGGELWNGNGFLKLRNLRMSRLFIARVDTSVGAVQLTPQATLRATVRGPYTLSAGAWLSLDPNAAGAAAATAIAGTAGQVTGTAAPAGLVAGDAVSIVVDGNAPVTVTFDGSSSAIADVVARINTVLGATIASDSAGNLRLTGQVLGTLGSITVDDVTAGTVAKLGFAATPSTASGTGNVGDTTAITATELAAIINGTAGLAAVTARVNEQGYLVLSASTSIQATAGVGATALGLSTDLVEVEDHAGGTIPAGLRVSDGTTTWVTMQSLTIAAGETQARTVKVRPALDDGTAVGGLAGAVTTITDQPSFADYTVSNALALTAALTDPQKDARYRLAFEATLGVDRRSNPSADADFSVCARRTDGTVRDGRQNAIDASAQGLRGRKYITRAALGLSPQQAVADVVTYRSDRVFYGYPGVRMRVPEIAARGAAGGLGFTDDGIILVGADNPIATLCCRLNPEQNPAESGTGLIDYLQAIEDIGRQLTIDDYKAFKAAGIMAPYFDVDTGWEIYSGVTSSLTSGRTTAARRKMADFIQDSAARIAKPYQKKLTSARERNAVADAIESFMQSLRPDNLPDLHRIDSYIVDRTSGNTPTRLALGVFVILITVRTLSSLDAIVLRTEIGENAITVTDVTAEAA